MNINKKYCFYFTNQMRMYWGFITTTSVNHFDQIWLYNKLTVMMLDTKVLKYAFCDIYIQLRIYIADLKLTKCYRRVYLSTYLFINCVKHIVLTLYIYHVTIEFKRYLLKHIIFIDWNFFLLLRRFNHLHLFSIKKIVASNNILNRHTLINYTITHSHTKECNYSKTEHPIESI